ncbi:MULTISPECIES: carboxymuconolactone decarboxylase family protein [Ramlibacter]|uniref:Carboxymuconolactone decarboxylase family protein n=1 Tax=Ramlibacter pinisoli TaxID=2682844 RepID=A0A6N8IMF8_9BURK|nr:MULTISPECIES: carboxymuconolactone decarboxylase family protein [Ramlibacter]MBA2960681.1 carboxymuconolactone decarboxylase family protein [Ramlibacter sp. CGMCC 1.13660]MVQ28011.1 carboxymuconolactone decarboxylase family protein [Ramlibacter pinisoli]
MPADTTAPDLRQGSATPWRERMPLPPSEAMSEAQRAAAQALIDGPRKGVYGPFLPLLRSPELLDRVARMGEYLRFGSVLPARVREFATCIAARHAGNQFEWHMHAPLAQQAGVEAAVLDALRQGARPAGLAGDDALVLDFSGELLHQHGCSEPTYARAVDRWGEQGVVELTALLGYFVLVSWVMNVAHTPAQSAAGAALPPFPL